MGTYKGERITITIPQYINEKIAAMALKETRTVAGMARILIEEAIKAREDKE